MLPVPLLATCSVAIAGTEVAFRSLSRDEVVTLAKFGDDTASAETFILSRACDIPEDEARDWRTKVSAETAGELLLAIARISGLETGEA